jgi:hypothetical protein
VTEDISQQRSEADRSQEVSAGYDSYRSLADSNLVIVVPKHAIPPFRFKAGGWELLQSSADLNPEAKARVAEKGFFIEPVNPMRMSSGELIPSNQDGPAPPSLEVEFALVIARMIDSVRNSPEDIRQVIYDLARYKLQEQLLHANAKDREHTQRALEGAIRGVEAFSEKHVHILPPEYQSHLNGPGTASTDLKLSPPPELAPQTELSRQVRLDSERNAGGAVHKSSPWSYLRRTAAMIVILVAILVVIRQREGLLYLAHNLPKLEWKTAIEERSAPSLASDPVVSVPPRAKSAALRPTDYGVYAISNDALFDLSSLPGRAPDIRIAISQPLTTPSRTILPNGRAKFIVFSRELASNVADRAEVRIIAKVAREYSAKVAGKKPADDAWVIRNISFPFRSSPVNDNSEMYELHSEDPALELPPGRYALVRKTQAYDFSVEGDVADDPRHCIERIVGSTGIFYSDCKSPEADAGFRF